MIPELSIHLVWYASFFESKSKEKKLTIMRDGILIYAVQFRFRMLDVKPNTGLFTHPVVIHYS